MYHDDVDKIANTSANKVKIVEESFTKYFGRAVMAGIFIMLATILSYTIGEYFLPIIQKQLGYLVLHYSALPL